MKIIFKNVPNRTKVRKHLEETYGINGEEVVMTGDNDLTISGLSPIEPDENTTLVSKVLESIFNIHEDMV